MPSTWRKFGDATSQPDADNCPGIATGKVRRGGVGRERSWAVWQCVNVREICSSHLCFFHFLVPDGTSHPPDTMYIFVHSPTFEAVRGNCGRSVVIDLSCIRLECKTVTNLAVDTCYRPSTGDSSMRISCTIVGALSCQYGYVFTSCQCVINIELTKDGNQLGDRNWSLFN